jgi:hypothetical protein
MLTCGAGAHDAAAQRRPHRFQRQLVDDAPVVVERAVDAIELLLEQRVGGAAPLQRIEPLVVRLLERLEGAHEVLEGLADVRRDRLRLQLRHGVILLQVVSQCARRLGDPRSQLRLG